MVFLCGLTRKTFIIFMQRSSIIKILRCMVGPRFQKIALSFSVHFLSMNKVGCVYPMVIWSKFCMRQNRDDYHREDILHFISWDFSTFSWRTLNCWIKHISDSETLNSADISILFKGSKPFLRLSRISSIGWYLS